MEIVRYAERADLLEVRSKVLNNFPAYMNHNEPGGKYWGSLYEEFPEFQLALLDGNALVGEVHSLPVRVDGELPKGGDEAFERGWRSATATCSRCSKSASIQEAAAVVSRPC